MHEWSEVDAGPAIDEATIDRKDAAVAGSGEGEAGVPEQIVLTCFDINTDMASEKVLGTLKQALIFDFEGDREHRAIRLDGVEGSSGVQHAVSHKDVPPGRRGIRIALRLAGHDLGDQRTGQ